VKLIVGLGNPGGDYEHTRHNLGFQVVDELARREGVHWRNDSDMKVSFAKSFAATPFFVAKPQTYMNRSGFAVARFVEYHNVEIDDLLVIVDDAELPLGKIRVREKGSGGSHNGLRSVVEQLGTTAFPRMRLGVGRGVSDPARRDLASHVLGRFDQQERELVDALIARAADAASMFVAEDIRKVMNTYNPDPASPDVD
jgi:PTH1 family peptidyl-tRNA hydrolase